MVGNAERCDKRVRVEFNNPNEQGLPTDEEFPALCELDEALDGAIAGLGGLGGGEPAD